MDDDGADAEEHLTERALQGNIPDSVQENLLIFPAQQTGLPEQPILGDGIFGKAQRQTEITLPILPDICDICLYISTLGVGVARYCGAYPCAYLGA